MTPSGQRETSESDHENESTFRVLVVDAHPSSARGVEVLLREAANDIEVVGVASSLKEAKDFEGIHLPEVLIVDFTTLREGVRAIEEALRLFPGARLVVHTASESLEDVHAATRMGASAYLSKRAPAEILLASVRMVAGGGIFVGPHVVTQLLRETLPGGIRLTEEELKLLHLLADGGEYPEIAQRLALSESTLKRRIREVEGKLGVRNRIQAAVRAARLGLI